MRKGGFSIGRPASLGLEQAIYFPCDETGTVTAITDSITGGTIAPAGYLAADVANAVRMLAVPNTPAILSAEITQPGGRDWTFLNVVGAVDNPGLAAGNAPSSIYLGGMKLHPYFAMPTPILIDEVATEVTAYTGSPAPGYNYNDPETAYNLSPYATRVSGQIYVLCSAKRGRLMEHYVGTLGASAFQGQIDWDLLVPPEPYAALDPAVYWDNGLWQAHPEFIIGHARYGDGTQVTDYQQDVYGIELDYYNYCPSRADILRMMNAALTHWPNGLKASAVDFIRLS